MLFKLFAPHEMAGRYIQEHIVSTWNIRTRELCRKNNINVVEHSVKFKNPVKFSNQGAQVEAQTRQAVKELIRAKPYIKNKNVFE